MDYNTKAEATGSTIGAPLQNISNFERVISGTIGVLLMFNGIQTTRRQPLNGISRALIGYGLVVRGVSGICPAYSQLKIDGTKQTSVNIRATFTVNKPKSEVYSSWRNLENLPLFMKHLSSVKEMDSTRSHWEAKIPMNNPVSLKWDAEIMKDEPGSFLSWRSLPGATLENAGKVEFRDALGHKGTEIRVMISYRPPAGNIGSGIAHLLNPLFKKMVKDDIMGFKEFIELRSEPLAG